MLIEVIINDKQKRTYDTIKDAGKLKTDIKVIEANALPEAYKKALKRLSMRQQHAEKPLIEKRIWPSYHIYPDQVNTSFG